MQTFYEEFQRLGAEIIAVSMDEPLESSKMALSTQASYKILSDPDGHVAKLYGVYNLLGDGIATPATFIISKDQNIEWQYIGQNVGDRPNTEAILDAIKYYLKSKQIL